MKWNEALVFSENRQQTDFPVCLSFTAPVVDSTPFWFSDKPQLNFRFKLAI